MHNVIFFQDSEPYFENNAIWCRQLSSWKILQFEERASLNSKQNAKLFEHMECCMHVALFWNLEESVALFCATSPWYEWDIWLHEYIIVG